MDRSPGTTEVAARLGTNRLNIELGVIDVGDLPGAITVPRGRQRQFPVPRRVRVSGASTLPGFRLRAFRPLSKRPCESLVTRGIDHRLGTGAHQLPLRRCLGLLLEGLVASDRLAQELMGPLREAWGSVATLGAPIEQPDEAAAESIFGRAHSGVPGAERPRAGPRTVGILLG